MKKYIASFIGVCAVIVLLLLIMKVNRKIAYVSTYQVYEQFKLKKELEEKLNKTQLSRQVILDSLKAKMQFTISNNLLSESEKSLKINEIKENYYLKEKQFNQENESQSQQYTAQIWEQLNQYMKEYGKEEGYTYILGASGQGNIMYADEAEDISKQVIEFVNKKYDGKTK